MEMDDRKIQSFLLEQVGDEMGQEPSFGKSYGWSLGATDSLSKSHSGITFENTLRVPG